MFLTGGGDAGRRAHEVPGDAGWGRPREGAAAGGRCGRRPRAGPGPRATAGVTGDGNPRSGLSRARPGCPCCWGEAAPCAQRDGRGARQPPRNTPSTGPRRNFLRAGGLQRTQRWSTMVNNPTMLRGEISRDERTSSEKRPSSWHSRDAVLRAPRSGGRRLQGPGRGVLPPPRVHAGQGRGGKGKPRATVPGEHRSNPPHIRANHVPQVTARSRRHDLTGSTAGAQGGATRPARHATRPVSSVRGAGERGAKSSLRP